MPGTDTKKGAEPLNFQFHPNTRAFAAKHPEASAPDIGLINHVNKDKTVENEHNLIDLNNETEQTEETVDSSAESVTQPDQITQIEETEQAESENHNEHVSDIEL